MKSFFTNAEMLVSEYIPMASILVLGFFLTLKSGFFQLRNLKKSITQTLCADKKTNAGVNSFQAVCTTLASTIGTGNIVGVATAVSIGGPGAVFWMVLSAFLCMIIKAVEIALSVKFKKNDDKICGPISYIKQTGKAAKILIFLFCLFCVFSSFTSGNITQINTVAVAISTSKYIRFLIGACIGALVFCIMSGGVKRIAKFSEIAVPIMSVIYIILCLGVIAFNIRSLPEAIYLIFKGAFSPKSVTGGAIGSIAIVSGIGISRGIFSNEAGLGTAAFAHLQCENSMAINEAKFGIFEVFFDTVVMCVLTGIAIVSADIEIDYGEIMSSNLIGEVFKNVYGEFAGVIIAIMLVFFGFTSIVGWGYFGLECVEYKFSKYKKLYMVIYPFFCVLGAVCSIGTAWRLAAFFNGLMLCINMYCLMFNSTEILTEMKSN